MMRRIAFYVPHQMARFAAIALSLMTGSVSRWRMPEAQAAVSQGQE
ncbi:hypothetical protein [Asaia prunellae]|nr:hypothetical protein [Asaia prunellae]